MEKKMTQKEEMQRYGLDFGNEVLEQMKGIAPRKSRSEELENDIGMLEMNLRESKHLLENAGAGNFKTVLQLQNLVYLNSDMSEKYNPRKV